MPNPKRPRRTRERILETALALFNERGEPNVTTGHIADEMNISPGNLYYHFPNKEAITADLFHAFEQKMGALLEIPDERRFNVEDTWLLLHLVLEVISEYRFIYRDLEDLLSRDRRLLTRFGRLLQAKKKTMIKLGESMVDAGSMRASAQEITAMAENAVLIATYWLSYRNIQHTGREPAAPNLGKAAYQILSLLAPFLGGDERRLLERLGENYLN